MIVTLIKNLALTVLLEGALAAGLTRNRRMVYHSFLCNLLTNPPLNLALMAIAFYGGIGAYWIALPCLELAVVLVEAAVYKRLDDCSTPRALGVSALLNAFSFGMGLLIAKLT